MGYPSLVPNSVCKTDIHVKIGTGEISNQGEPIFDFDATLKCNFQDNSYQTLTADKSLVTLSGKAFFNGDIAPELKTIVNGEVEVFGVTRKIYRGTKARNPDGTVNYCLLELE
ncbi:MAG: hypothetical protein ACK5KR_08955 [Breznakia sp.]